MPTTGTSTVTEPTPRDRLLSTVEQAAQALDPVITNLDDGCVRVTLGDICTTCSSHHLVPDKIAQLRRYPL